MLLVPNVYRWIKCLFGYCQLRFLEMTKLKLKLLGLVLLVLNILVSECYAMNGQCPSVCGCRWKGGKETVECIDKALIKIPKSIDAATQVLDLSRNNLQTLTRETFIKAGLVNLQRVFLRSCHIGQIDDAAFRGLTNLIELDLSFNLLTTVPSVSFRDVPNLRDLILANNPIQKIDGYAFQTVPSLVKLDLSNCELQTVAPRAFDGIKMLESLKLNGNKLSELRHETVGELRKLHSIELHQNPWYCDCRMREIKRWLAGSNIPHPVAPMCSGGPEAVLHKSFPELQLDDFACKPEILPVNRYVEARAGDNATIVCRVNAVPAAHVTWYWNGRLMQNNSAFSSHQKIYIFEEGDIDKRSSLILTNSQETDSSEFYCEAKNRAGNAEANFTLRVSLRAAGMVTLGSGQIAGLSAALVILILFILLIILVLLVRLRRMPFSESKTPGQIEVVTVVNGGAISNGKVASAAVTLASSPTLPAPEQPVVATDNRKPPQELNFCNPVQKPPRSDIPYTTAHYNGSGSIMNPGSCYVSPSSGSGNNPDLINDTKMPNEIGTEEGFTVEPLDRPLSGEYSRNADSLYPSGIWDQTSEGDVYHSRHNMSATNPGFHYDDKTPIIGGEAALSAEDVTYRAVRAVSSGYPPDYGLPIVEARGSTDPLTSSTSHLPAAGAKTLRVWQKGAVPVLPPVTALKRALTHNRSSPDEGYQEGCGTDV